MSDEGSLLPWTGHPLLDVGVATVCALTGKQEPAELTLDDLDQVGADLQRLYRQPILIAYLTCVFPNAPFINFNIGEVRLREKLDWLFRAHRGVPDLGTEGLRCVLTGQAATRWVTREQMPMLTGVGALNFFPAGRSALPVSGPALLALQALPLGGRRSEGKLLVVHCDDNAWTMQFAREYVRRNRTLLELAARDELPDYDGPSPLLEREHAGWDAAKKRPKYPDAKSPQSYVMADLQEVAARRVAGRMRQAHTSVTIYQMSNSGQGPSLAVFHIPGQLVSFLQSVAREPYRHPWSRIVAAAWRATKGEDSPPESSDAPEAPKKRAKTKKERPPLPGGPGRSGNDLYNDLYPVFETGQVDLAAAQKVVRRHLLRDPVKWLDRQQQKLHVPDEAREMIHWDLTQLFLQEVLGMDRQRVDRIRSFADRLAEYIHQSHDKRFFLDLVFASQEWRFRNALTKAQRNEARERRQLLFGLDEYLDVFLADDAAGVARWGLIRDLISIRLVERLFALGFFGAAENLELLTEHEEREEDAPREVAVDD